MERAIFITKCTAHFIGTDERICMQIHTLTHFLTTPSGIRQIKIELDFRAEKWKLTTGKTH